MDKKPIYLQKLSFENIYQTPKFIQLNKNTVFMFQILNHSIQDYCKFFGKKLMSQKMTLQQYIESVNYKRRLYIKSKSKGKQAQRCSSPPPLEVIASLPSVTGSLDPKQQAKILESPFMSNMINQIKQIDQELQGFSLIHKKVEMMKEFARQKILNDRDFVLFCKKLQELESVYRLELIEAYKFQLFKYKFDIIDIEKQKLDDDKRKMIKLLNDLYMNSKFQYKKFISKEKPPQLSKENQEVLELLIKDKGKVGAKMKQEAEKSKEKPITAQEIVETQTISKSVQPKQNTNIFQFLMMAAKNQTPNQLKNTGSNEFIYAPKQQYKNLLLKPQIMNINIIPSNEKRIIEKSPSNIQTIAFKETKNQIQSPREIRNKTKKEILQQKQSQKEGKQLVQSKGDIKVRKH